MRESKKIELLIRTTLTGATSVINNLPYKDKAWTEEIMTRLCNVGQEQDYYVCVSGVSESNRGEWLYDMTWLQYEGNQLMDVGLVLECEWGYFSAVRADFEKLMLAKADLRCMIFWAANRQEAMDDILRIFDTIKEFQKTKDTDIYLFCVWLEDEAHFYFYNYPNG